MRSGRPSSHFATQGSGGSKPSPAQKVPSKPPGCGNRPSLALEPRVHGLLDLVDDQVRELGPLLAVEVIGHKSPPSRSRPMLRTSVACSQLHTMFVHWPRSP